MSLRSSRRPSLSIYAPTEQSSAQGLDPLSPTLLPAEQSSVTLAPAGQRPTTGDGGAGVSDARTQFKRNMMDMMERMSQRLDTLANTTVDMETEPSEI